MRRHSLLVAALTAIILLACASTSFAVFNSYVTGVTPDPNSKFQAPFDLKTLIEPDGWKTFKLQQGWWNDRAVWFIQTETSDIRYSQTNKAVCTVTKAPVPGTTSIQSKPGGYYKTYLPYCNGLTLDYKLFSAQCAPPAARAMGIVINPPASQGPIFEAAPAPGATDGYSGLWAIFYIRWRVGADKVILRSWVDVATRLGTELDYSNVYCGTEIDPNSSFAIVDAPILAIGKLGGPWKQKPDGDLFNYRIQQAQVCSDYAQTKLVQLPTWYVFVAEYITNKVKVAQVIIPDVWDPAAADNPAAVGTLAYKLGANWAPGLQNMPDSDTQIFYEVFPGDDPKLPLRPPYQFPIIEEAPYAFYLSSATCVCPKPIQVLNGNTNGHKWFCPRVDPFSWRNVNKDYSAIMRHVVLRKVLTGDLQADYPLISAVIDNDATIAEMILNGLLTEEETGVVFNAPVVPPFLDLPQPQRGFCCPRNFD